MALEIQVLPSDMYINVAGLNQLMRSQTSRSSTNTSVNRGKLMSSGRVRSSCSSSGRGNTPTIEAMFYITDVTKLSRALEIRP
jgi:hypothetical protein